MLSAFGAGLLFGIGLWVSGMANPRKVLDFLDIAGNWDPSLLLVMAGAIAVTLPGFRPLKNKIKIEKTRVDRPLVLGAALFGAGWGIAGYCPGPAITALSNLSVETLVFVAAMIGGGLAHKLGTGILIKFPTSAGPGA